MMNVPATSLWQSIAHLWCRHRETVMIPKREGMPAHIECVSCGWREPVIAGRPQGVRTWDSTRDEARYEREKKRRAQADEQRRLLAVASLSALDARPARTRRGRRGNVVELKRASTA